MTDQPTTPRGEPSQYVAGLRAEVERLRLQVAGEQIPGELISAPGLDVDQQLRAHALAYAALRLQGITSHAIPASTVDTARVFEAYLRGDQ